MTIFDLALSSLKDDSTKPSNDIKKWSFRPSTFLNNYYDDNPLSQLEKFRRDNDRALRDQVGIPPLASTTTSSSQSLLRICQWNVRYFSEFLHTTTTAGGPPPLSSIELATAMIDALLQVHPDVIVLNEFGMSQVAVVMEDDEAGRQTAVQLLETNGYTVVIANNTICPTAIATRLPIQRQTQFPLDLMRSAIGIQIQMEQETVTDCAYRKQCHSFWIYGTQLDDSDDNNGSFRLQEIKTWVETIGVFSDNVLLVGDLQQPREQDATRHEWKLLAENRNEQNSPLHDGVDYLLKAFGFSCVWDTSTLPWRHINWNKRQPPPSTHCSGTIRDYTYWKDDKLELAGVYVSPSNFSDHRMIVCDWKLKRPGGSGHDCVDDDYDDNITNSSESIEGEGWRRQPSRVGPLRAIWNITRRILPWGSTTNSNSNNNSHRADDTPERQ